MSNLMLRTLASTGMLISQAVLSAEPVYPVISPLADRTVKMIEMVPRLDSLSNKTVCLVSNNSFKVDVTNPAIARALQESYPGLKLVPHTEMPYTELPGARPGAPWETFANEFRSKGCNAVISGNGG
jgi:hypothetical protein